MDTLSLTQEAKICNGEKTLSLRNGAGKTGQLAVNKWRGNKQTTWKRIQNNDSKYDQKPWKQNGGNARIN